MGIRQAFDQLGAREKSIALSCSNMTAKLI
jgi:hypothetical protein